MKNIKCISLILACCLIFAIWPSSAAADISAPHLQSADAVLVIDMVTGIPLYEKNADQYHSIASLTKIMTCLLAVEAVERGEVSLNEIVTAGDDCLQGLDTSSSNAGITPGETFSFQDLIYMALVHSANDACNVIAAKVSGTISAFVNRMNERADELGCQNTHFVDTDGMLNRTEMHYSCPRDLYLITKEALTHPLFATVCSTSTYQVNASNYRPAFTIHNSNALMSTDGIYGSGYIYDGIIGVKTGFTKPAGYCLVSACKRSQGYIMVIVLGCNGPLTYTFAGEYQNFQDSITLYDWAFKNYSNKTLFLAGEPLKRLSVEKAQDNGTVALCAAENLTLLIPNDVQESDIVMDIQPYEGALIAPIEEGQELGTINVYVKGKLYSSVLLTADASVSLDKKLVRQENIRNFFHSKMLRTVIVTLILVVLGLVFLRLFLKMKRRQELQQRMQIRDNQKRMVRREARMQASSGQRSARAPQRNMQPRKQYTAEELAARKAANEGRQNLSSYGYSNRPQAANSSFTATNNGIKIERITRELEVHRAQQPKPVIHNAAAMRHENQSANLNADVSPAFVEKKFETVKNQEIEKKKTVIHSVSRNDEIQPVQYKEKPQEPVERQIKSEDTPVDYDLEALLKAYRNNQQ